MEHRGLLVIANEAEDAGGCSLFGASGILFFMGFLMRGTLAGLAAYGGAAIALLLGGLSVWAERAAALRWFGFALSPDGVAEAVARGIDVMRAAQVDLEPTAPLGDGEPKLVLATERTPDAQAVHLAFVGFYVGAEMVCGVKGGAFRVGRIADGAMFDLPRRIEKSEHLRPLADALQDAWPQLTVSMTVERGPLPAAVSRLCDGFGWAVAIT